MGSTSRFILFASAMKAGSFMQALKPMRSAASRSGGALGVVMKEVPISAAFTTARIVAFWRSVVASSMTVGTSCSS